MSRYFDYAAATPLSPTVERAMAPYWRQQFYNPSAMYLAARQVRHELNDARQTVARHLGAQPGEIIFTAGGTEANNLAIHGVMSQFPGARMLTSAIEHESVLGPAAGYQAVQLPVSPQAMVDVNTVAALLSDEVVLISCMLANNEVGTIQPLSEIAALVKQIRADRLRRGVDLPLYLHSDACQALNYVDCHVGRLGVDLLTINGGKIYGPKQSGALYVRAGISLEPCFQGGGQEHGLRSGTENVPAICGLAAAVAEAAAKRGTEHKRLGELCQAAIQLLAEQLPQATINGHPKKHLVNNLHITIAGYDNERLMMMLDERGCQVATGSACSAASGEPSHVLTAIGMSDELARSSLRITFGRQTTIEDVQELVKALAESVSAVDNLD